MMLTRILRRQSSSRKLQYDEFINELKKKDSLNSMITPQRHLYSEKIDLDAYEDKVVESNFVRPPTLAHNLDRIVRTEGIYKAQEFSALNNDTFLERILPYDKTVLEKFPPYTPPSQDELLKKKAIEEGCKYYSGSSSVTEIMQHLYYAVTNFRSPDTVGLGRNYDHKNMNYMSVYRKPVIFCLRKTGDNLYAIDSDKSLSLIHI